MLFGTQGPSLKNDCFNEPFCFSVAVPGDSCFAGSFHPSLGHNVFAIVFYPFHFIQFSLQAHLSPFEFILAFLTQLDYSLKLIKVVGILVRIASAVRFTAIILVIILVESISGLI